MGVFIDLAGWYGETFCALCVDVAAGEVFGCVIFLFGPDVEIALAWERGGVADQAGHVFRDIADVMAVGCEDFDGIGIVLVGGFWFEGADVLTFVL